MPRTSTPFFKTNDNLNYVELKSYINKIHPRKIDQDGSTVFSMSDPMDSFWCNKKYKDVEITDNHGRKRTVSQREIREVNKQLGLGVSLFMMTTKALAQFFIVMTILNVPFLIIYDRGNQMDV